MKLHNIALLIGLVCLVPVCSKADESSDDSRQQSESLRIAVQGICPVSGQDLGEHGAPVKVKIGEEELFLCCKACAKGQVNSQHWATIHANFAKAQRICPVMKHALPDKAKWTIVEGRIVYVCCPPCIDKIKADPKTYLAAVDKLYAESLKEAKRQSPVSRR